MNELVRIAAVTERREAPVSRRLHARHYLCTVSRFALEDAFEDVQLNAIADERAEGPFVSVSLDEL